ncbi:MAG: hypothetical protein IKN57_12500, partial [Parasporobacterium sp.]|nr:hypothetical protein [Parasporobacterium sp.]
EEGLPRANKKKKKTKAGRLFIRCTEVLAIITSFIGGGRFGTYIYSYMKYTIVGEVALRFGRGPYEKCKQIMALIDAMDGWKYVLPAIVTAILLIGNLIALICRGIRRSRIRKKARYGNSPV